MMTATAVCGRLGICRTTLWKMQKDGEFPQPVRISRGRIAWRDADVERWLIERGAGAA